MCPQPLCQLNCNLTANCSSQIPRSPSDAGAALQPRWQPNGPQCWVIWSQLSVKASTIAHYLQASTHISDIWIFSPPPCRCILCGLLMLYHITNEHLINVVHSLYGCGSPHPMALDAARRTSSSPSTPATSVSTPSTPQFIVPSSPPATPATPRPFHNPPSAPMPISPRYRPYSVTAPWGASSPSSPGHRGFSFPGPSPTLAGPSVPPNTPVPVPPPSPQSLSSSLRRARNQSFSTTPTMVPSSPRLNTGQAAFARIPPSRYLLRISLWSAHTSNKLKP